ncbi:hypothetical protein TSTA_004360 [Talaromyces stipitatus ATCC 10500]|uniref:Uncharacterized protein n=1 Tax=Talaromyces stipitatus (strain ATCC 10500 / CBS 375.48 / QM 6759 / NRRL 1006) TaxID=441959 RepID=B8MTI1_TALSN|nr:uncharacterized protein TSTA_004360 [Talaromyces stipitatus ATCC 10500]EED12387.1 hypothetical protein TSTA_004360 [Talaromyces stipitatus ATCC 10500]
MASIEARIRSFNDEREKEHLHNYVYVGSYDVYNTNRHLLRALSHICPHQLFEVRGPLRCTNGDMHYENLAAEICPVTVVTVLELDYDTFHGHIKYQKGHFHQRAGASNALSATSIFKIPQNTMLSNCHKMVQNRPWTLIPETSNVSRILYRDQSETGFALRSGATGQAFENAPGLSQTDLMERNLKIL